MQLLIEIHQLFHSRPFYKFQKRKVSGTNRGCITRLFQKYPMMTHIECNDSVTCNFIKMRKYDHNEFSKYSYREYNRYSKWINIHLNSYMHQNTNDYSAVANGFNNNQYVNSQINTQLGTIQVNNREYLKLLLFQTTQLLAKEGLVYRDKIPEDSNFINPLNELLETKGIKSHLNKNNEYTCSEIQNKIIKFFAR